MNLKNWLWKVSQHNGAVPKPHISSTYSVATHSHTHLIISGWTTSSPDAFWGEPPHPACQPRRAVQPPSASEAASVVRRPALAPLLGRTHASSQQLPSPWMRGQLSAAQQPFRRHLVFRGWGIHSVIWVSPPLSEPKKGSRQVVSRRCGLCLDGGKRKKKGRTTNWVVTKDANNLLGFLLIDHAKKKKKIQTHTHTKFKHMKWKSVVGSHGIMWFDFCEVFFNVLFFQLQIHVSPHISNMTSHTVSKDLYWISPYIFSYNISKFYCIQHMNKTPVPPVS